MWPGCLRCSAPMRLAALSLSGHPDPERFAAEFSGSERTVAEYLLAEVLERQREEVRRLLLRTSVLERVNGELADLLTGGSGGERMLHELDEANAFVVPLDAARSWFRYHHLFADLLQLELRRSEPDEAALHQSARRSRPSTAARPGCSSPTCTSGRAPNGCAAWNCVITTRRVSGRGMATTSTQTHGKNSGTRAIELAGRHRRVGQSGDQFSGHHHAGSDGPARPPGRTAPGRAADRRRRLRRRAVVLNRLGAGRLGGRHRGAAPGRRGLAVPHPGTAARRRTGVAWPDRRLLRLGTWRRRAADAAGRGFGRGPAAGHPAAPPARRQRYVGSLARLGPLAARPDLPRRARPGAGRGAGELHPDRRPAPGWTGYAGRIDQALLDRAAWAADTDPLAFICGPTSFVETAAAGLVALGYRPERVKTERFGATGGR
jgi:hypothetical protein